MSDPSAHRRLTLCADRHLSQWAFLKYTEFALMVAPCEVGPPLKLFLVVMFRMNVCTKSFTKACTGLHVHSFDLLLLLTEKCWIFKSDYVGSVRVYVQSCTAITFNVGETFQSGSKWLTDQQNKTTIPGDVPPAGLKIEFQNFDGTDFSVCRRVTLEHFFFFFFFPDSNLLLTSVMCVAFTCFFFFSGKHKQKQDSFIPNESHGLSRCNHCGFAPLSFIVDLNS